MITLLFVLLVFVAVMAGVTIFSTIATIAPILLVILFLPAVDVCMFKILRRNSKKEKKSKK